MMMISVRKTKEWNKAKCEIQKPLKIEIQDEEKIAKNTTN